MVSPATKTNRRDSIGTITLAPGSGNVRSCPRLSCAGGFLAVLAMAFPGMAVHAAPEPIASEPLILGSSQAPANLYLTPSVEWPTINSQANTDPNYSSSKEFVGYFNSDACYAYVYDSTADQRRFEPQSATSNRRCDGGQAGDWNGNFLNWAATQTIDPFRKALTGGLRVKDTTETTWLEKARYDNSGGSGIFPNRSITDVNDEIAGATPFGEYTELHTRVRHLGTEMRFRVENSALDDSVPTVDYDPSQDYNGSAAGTLDPGEAYEVEIRVEVCDEDSAAGVEENCVAYGANYKPEGLVQANALNLRYSVFGYLNDSDVERDGGVLRAKKKYVGPEKIDPATGEKISNPNREWNDDGTLVQNPNPNEAAATEDFYNKDVTVENSGVINYINKFGQLTNNDHKNFDPVSELFYAMTRYLRNEGPVESYHARTGAAASTVQKWVDKFPVVTQWDDPVEGFECSPNVALGIGDVFTHRDKNLPGSRYGTDEPATPEEVSGDNEVDVVELTNKVGELEGLGDIGSTNDWTGRFNSAYIAGLAYDAHTRDQRPGVDGEQRLSTYWVDVVERQDLKGFSENQYALAAKYGGFAVPSDFDPGTRTDPLPEEWWWSGETASIANDATSFKRPENYFLANNAKAMTAGLAKAFNRINTEAQGSSAAVATNTTRLTTSTLIYQGRFNSVDWSGDVLAFDVNDSDGTVDTSNPVWQAAENIPAPAERKLFTVKRATGDLHESGAVFEWSGTDSITADQQDLLDRNPETGTDDGKGADRLAYLRGDPSNEQRNGGAFRNRLNTVLGDVVNSNPYVARGQNFGYGSVPGDAGTTYRAYVEAKQDRRDILYVGANDGMLHAIDATDTGGDELFAYIPNAAFEELNGLSSTSYTHRFYVDGSPTVADVYADLDSDDGDRDGNGSNADWHSLLAGSMGAGGKAVFVLDVTNPLGTTFGASGFGIDDVLFEFTDPNLGHTFGQPRLVPINDGSGGADWVLLVGDGYDETTDDGSGNTIVEGDGSETAGLHVIPLENPGNAVFIDTGAGTGEDPNGISELTPVDIDGDRVTDFVYAGDLEGNMWKFDPTTGSETVQKLFQAVDSANGNPQPITTPPAVGPNDNPDILLNVYFGTGQFFREGDGAVGADPQVQTFYAVADRNDGREVNDNGLVEQEIIFQDSEFRITSDNDVNYSSNKDGWFIDLIPPSLTAGTGERVINPPVLRGNRIIFQTNIPEPGICKVGGRSWLMEMNAQDGSRLENGVFDTDGDGDIDADDKLDDGTDVLKHAGGLALDGLSAGLAILDTDREVEFKQISKSSGDVETVTESQSQRNTGRKSWEQLR